jgi:hypothetical protein
MIARFEFPSNHARVASRALILALFVALFSTTSRAQQEPKGAPRLADDGGAPFVYFVHGYYPQWDEVKLGDRVSVHVQNFGKLLDSAKGDCAQIVLFLNGISLKGMRPESCDRASGHVRFRLLRTDDSDEAWHALLGRPRHFVKHVSVSVGSDPQYSVQSRVTDFRIEALPPIPFAVFSILFLAGLILFLVLCHKSDLIRLSSGPAPANGRRPFSLALFQMSVWFFLVIAAYIFLWLITGELDSISGSVLALIGIGAGTAFGSTIIDRSQQATAESDSGGPGTTPPSRGFIHDILEDGHGISLHRFQMFVWTIVLAVIFCASVYQDLSMPEFSATLLGLMGISSGTYLGFKIPENAPKNQGGPGA